jgi:hypothetical protein
VPAPIDCSHIFICVFGGREVELERVVVVERERVVVVVSRRWSWCRRRG